MRNLRALIAPLFAAVLIFYGPPVISADGPKHEPNGFQAVIAQLQRQYREPLEVAERLLVPEHARSVAMAKNLQAELSTATEPPALSIFATLDLSASGGPAASVPNAVEPTPVEEEPLVVPAPPPPPAPTRVPAPPVSTASAWQWPTRSRLITDAYGVRRGNGYHGGIDIADSWKAQVASIGPGVVTFAGNQGATYGLSVLIQHPNGWVSRYGHLSGIYVRSGQRVVGGQLIGQMGDSGYAFGTHLHLEIIVNGRVIDPLTVLPR